MGVGRVCRGARRLRVLAGALLCLASGCVSGASYHGPWLHRSLFEAPARELPSRVLLLPARVVAGTRDEQGEFKSDAELSRRFAHVLESVMAERLAALGVLEPVAAPTLDEAQRANLDAHAELFVVVARAAAMAGNGGSTPAYKLREFDYSIGPGLAELARAGGAEVGLIVALQDSGLLAGLVDLSSGDLLWLQRGMWFQEAIDPEGELLSSFERLWKDYPGTEAFARLREES